MVRALWTTSTCLDRCLGHNGAVGSTFTKNYAKGQPGSPKLEAAGLAWLAQAEQQGGVQVARVVKVTNTSLTLERLVNTQPALGAAEAFGRALAHTHAAGAPHFGAPPPTWSTTGAIGLAPLSYLVQPPSDPSWGSFYFQQRLWPYVSWAEQAGALPVGAAKLFDRLGERLVEGLFDAPGPALAPGVARLHGDLWAGNLLFSPPKQNGRWTGATVIDPAAQGGHGESDLAMLALFGAPGLETILAAYHEASALADGWRERVGLHQLHPLLVHACLFGGSYGRQALAITQGYL